jgi:hypothetical protein
MADLAVEVVTAPRILKTLEAAMLLIHNKLMLLNQAMAINNKLINHVNKKMVFMFSLPLQS